MILVAGLKKVCGKTSALPTFTPMNSYMASGVKLCYEISGILFNTKPRVAIRGEIA